MRKVAVLFLFFFSLVVNGCTTTKTAGVKEDLPQVVQIASAVDTAPDSAKKKKSDSTKKTNKLAKRWNIKPEGITQFSEDDDDISSLIDRDYYKDFDIPIVFNDAVKYFIQYFTTEKRKVFVNWLKRSRYYVPIMKEILKEQGLPEDLVYLAMIESGFNPKAYSPAAASGPWQFIYETGGRYGLKVNYWIDERRDPEKSTVAATKYLRDLFNQFGCWYLAAAGYNSGEKRVERAMEKHNTNDFWEIVKYNTLPRETREYIPKMIAAAIIAKDPEKFGFGAISYDQPVRFAQVKVPAGSPLTAIAKSASLDISALRSINPEILRGITPPDIDDYEVKLPITVDRNEFNGNLEAVLNSDKKITGYSAYKVKKGDTLARILKKFKMSYEDMQLVNYAEGDMKIKPGMVVGIPRFNGQSVLESIVQKSEKPSKQTEKQAAAKKHAKVVNQASIDKPDKPDTPGKPEELEIKTYHVVKKGETLSSISSRYGVDMSSLRAANNLKSNKVYPNMKLKLVSYSHKKEKTSVKIHVVKKGESLSSISTKYGVNISSLRTANNLKNDKVYPRMKLKIVESKG
ncbi:MAG: LysM peptidoglycan-binding domain-containing protein [Deltaproteobacteria bacterium]